MHTPTRVLKFLLSAGAVILAIVVVVGVVYQQRGASRDRELYPAPGDLVDIGGLRLHLNCVGQGEPTVVLEALSGGSSTEWAWIQPKLARTTRVCSYDRAGRGWSDEASPGDLWETVENLHGLLVRAEVPGPYVLVGHSIGGLYVRGFAQRYPSEVSGIALLDSSHPEQFDRYPELEDADATVKKLLWTFPWMARVGLFRYYFAQGGEIDFQDLPPRAHEEMTALWSSPEFFENMIAEIQLAPDIFSQARDLVSLGDIRLAIISAEKQPEFWRQLQRELATLSKRSTHVIVPDSTHGSLAFNPDHAKQTAGTILDLIAAVREER